MPPHDEMRDDVVLSEHVQLHNQIYPSRCHNYKHSRIPLKSNLNIPLWRKHLHDYSDNIICDYLEFGWPVGYQYEVYGFPVSNSRSHRGAMSFPAELDKYLAEERSRGSVAGPFSSIPFHRGMAVSPLNTVPKKDTDERRVILSRLTRQSMPE